MISHRRIVLISLKHIVSLSIISALFSCHTPQSRHVDEPCDLDGIAAKISAKMPSLTYISTVQVSELPSWSGTADINKMTFVDRDGLRYYFWIIFLKKAYYPEEVGEDFSPPMIGTEPKIDEPVLVGQNSEICMFISFEDLFEVRSKLVTWYFKDVAQAFDLKTPKCIEPYENEFP